MRLPAIVSCVLLCAVVAAFVPATCGQTVASCSSSNIASATVATNGSITSVTWLKDSSGVATPTGLLLLSDGSIWRSKDGGLTLEPMATHLNEDQLRGVQQAADGSVVYLLTNGPWMWVSEDRAETFENVSLPLYAHDMLPHPNKSNLVLYNGLTECCQQNLACTSCVSWLMASEDRGRTWTNITDYLSYRVTLAYAWSPVTATSSDSSVAYVSYADKTGDQRVKLGEAMNLNLIKDFRNPTDIYSTIPNGGPFYFTSSGMYMMARVSTGRPGLSQVTVSRDYGQTFTVVAFPPVSNFDAQRQWLATESGNPFLGSFDGPDYTNGNVFLSTGATSDFTIALEDVVSRFGNAHWTHIGASIPGTYIANVNPETDPLSIDTVITFDHGSYWHPLRLAGGSRTDPAQRVHLTAPYRGSKFHAPVSSPGLVLATGQLGPHLTSGQGERILVSRDGGRSWTPSLQGSYVVFGANGGTVLFAADDSGAYSKVVSYSLDFGVTWNQCELAPTNVRVISMRPNYNDHLSPIVIIDAVQENGQYAIFTLNVTALYDRQCTYADFNNWDLVDDSGQKCVFGLQRSYSRRASTSICQKVVGQARLVASSTCACDVEDFICPYCYKRNSKGNCDFMWYECGDISKVRPDAPKNCSGTFELEDEEDAIAKHPDTFCVGGKEEDDFDADISCPPPPDIDNPPPPVSTLQGSVGVTIAAIALALCGILIVALYYIGRNFFVPDDKAAIIAAWKSAPPPIDTDKEIHMDSLQKGMAHSPSDNLVSNPSHPSDRGVQLSASAGRDSPSPLLYVPPRSETLSDDGEEYDTLDV